MSRWLPLALLVLAGLAHAPALSGELVWDDVILIRDNPAIHTLDATFDAAFGDFFAQAGGQPQSGFLRPVPTLLNGATYAAFGATAWPYRLTNWLLHLATVFLLFRLFRRLEFDALAAALGAGLFAVHPLQAESVAFVSGRTDLLAALFFVATILLYLRARAGSTAAAMGAALTYALALGSKEVAFVLPAVLLLYEWGRADTERRWPALWPVGLVFLAALGGRLVSEVQPVKRLYFTAEQAPVAALDLVAHYAQLLVWPVQQRALYDHLSLGHWGMRAGVGLVVVVAVFAAVVALVRRAPKVAVGLGWSAACLLPVLHLVPIAAVAAERYLYLPLAGLALVVAALVQRVPRLAPVVGVVLLAGSLATAARSSEWHDEVSLWGVEIGRPAASYKAWQSLAIALAEQGQWVPARGAINEAFARHSSPLVWRNLVRVALGAPGPLSAESRAAFRAVALARPLDRAALAPWASKMQAAGYSDVARAINRLLTP